MILAPAGLAADLDPDNGKPVLLLIHGLLSSRNHWLPNLDALRTAFRLLRLELPGHGATPGPLAAEALHPDQLVAAIEATRSAFGIPRMGVCGQSFGAGLTLRYTLAHPERVSAQVFTNATAALSAPDANLIRLRLASRLTALRRDGAAALWNEPIHPRRARRFPAQIRDRLIEDAYHVRPLEYANLLEHGLAHLGLGSRLARTCVPTLLVNGQRERRFQPLRQAAEILFPAIAVADLDAGHSVNIEDGEGFNRVAMQFLSEHAV